MAGGLNTYGYAYQNPLIYFDPLGLSVLLDGDGKYHTYDPKEHLPLPKPDKPKDKSPKPTCAEQFPSGEGTDQINCRACCSTLAGALRSGGASACQESCMRNEGLTQAQCPQTSG